MRYLVTGGAGFIGSHLVEALSGRGDDVTVLDNLSTGDPANLAAVGEATRLVQGSVLDPLLVDEQVRQADVVVHLAASVGVRLVVEKPLHSFITNVRGSENVLDAAHRYGRKVFMASTSEIYGKGVGKTFAEDDDRLVGSNHISRWGYATSKSVDEVLAFAYHRERGLPTVIGRFFNTTGPRQSSAYGMVLPRFIEQAMAGSDLTVYGDGNQSRCFCHARDVVAAIVGLLDSDRAVGEAFNIGSTEEVTILELSERVMAAVGGNSRVRHVPYEDAYQEGFEDMRRRVPDTTKIAQAIGWTPSISLDGIISEMIEYKTERIAASGADDARHESR